MKAFLAAAILLFTVLEIGSGCQLETGASSSACLTTCQNGGNFDLTFVLDESASITSRNFHKFMKPTVKKIIQEVFNQSNQTNTIRVAVVMFASKTRLIFDFDKYKTKNQIFDAINKISQISGGTNLGGALKFVRNNLVQKTRSHLPHIVIVITDGDSNEGPPVQKEAEKLKASSSNVQILAIGVGQEIKRETLLYVASQSDYVSLERDFKMLYDRARKIAEEACETAFTGAFLDSTGLRWRAAQWWSVPLIVCPLLNLFLYR